MPNFQSLSTVVVKKRGCVEHEHRLHCQHCSTATDKLKKKKKTRGRTHFLTTFEFLCSTLFIISLTREKLGIMSLRFFLLVLPSMSFLCRFPASSCDFKCADKPEFTPSRLVVKFGEPTSANCSVCQHACKNNLFGVESPVGNKMKEGTTVLWTVDSLTEWHTTPICFYNNVTNYQCCSSLPVTVYKPPDNVSISFTGHSGPMTEGHQYSLQCEVQEVAPVQNLIVTFYRGQTPLGQPQSKKNTEKKPVTEIFTLNVTPSKEDHGVQYWCEAKLQLGPEGPQRPPVVTSPNITATVLYKPQLDGPSHPEPISITEGNPLHLTCSAAANPSPSYTWTFPSHSHASSNSSVLSINAVTSADSGTFTCSVSNSLGTVSVTFNVDVQDVELTSPRLLPATTTATETASVANNSSSSSSISIMLLHRLSLCFMLLFSALL